MVKNGGRRKLEGWKVGMSKLRTGERGAKGTWIRFTVLSQGTLQNELHHDQQAPCTLSSQCYSIHTGHSHLRGTYFKTHMIINPNKTMPLGAMRRGMMRGFPGSRRIA